MTSFSSMGWQAIIDAVNWTHIRLLDARSTSYNFLHWQLQDHQICSWAMTSWRWRNINRSEHIYQWLRINTRRLYLINCFLCGYYALLRVEANYSFVDVKYVKELYRQCLSWGKDIQCTWTCNSILHIITLYCDYFGWRNQIDEWPDGGWKPFYFNSAMEYWKDGS